MKPILPFIAMLVMSCAPSVREIVVRDASVSSNFHAVIVEDQAATAETLYRLEQDQALALGGDLRARVSAIRVSWAPVWAWLDLARVVHGRMAHQVVVGDQASLELSLAELEAIETKVALYIKQAKQRVGGAK